MGPVECDPDLVEAPMWAPDTEWENKKKVEKDQIYP